MKSLETERWIQQRMDSLKLQSILVQSGLKLPAKLMKRMVEFDINERNAKGETLVIAIIRHIVDPIVQVRFINMLVRAGADFTLFETKHRRTPLMFACLSKLTTIVRILLDHKQVNLTGQDQLGNTALMYAAICGHGEVVSMLVDELTKRWSFDVFRVKNCMGYTAESLAKKNGRIDCSK